VRAVHALFFALVRAGAAVRAVVCVRAVQWCAAVRGGWVARNRKFSSSRRIFLCVLVSCLYGRESIFLFSHTNEFCGK
jgi:hypothetical protein